MKRNFSYNEFSNMIYKVLKKHPEGLTWSEIKRTLDLPQKVPNNKWVKWMERDIGLIREKTNKGIIWRVE